VTSDSASGRTGPALNNQHLALFRIYVGYRALLALVLLIMLFSPNVDRMVGTLYPRMYTAVALAYLATSVPLMGNLPGRLLQQPRLLFLLFAVDIIAITLLAHSSGGMSSGLPILLVVTCAAGAILLRQRILATLVAALSVIALLADGALLIASGRQELSSMLPIGLLGMLIFFVSLSVQAFAQRLGRVEELARSRASDLYTLQRVNQQIVQRMNTGILLVDRGSLVQVVNKAASSLLAPERSATVEPGRPLADYSETLDSLFRQWQAGGRQEPRPFRVADHSPQVVANFVDLEGSDRGESLIFLEDYTPVTRYAQSLKVNSLGRLTASIAHEIRNPLGAISHAAQLLRESPDLSEADRRMAEIVIRHSQRVNEIIESVQQISRKAPPRPQQLELAEWLRDFVSTYLRTRRHPAEIAIDCDFRDLAISFDPENLSRILTNLLDNALRHSKLATGRDWARIRVGVDFNANRALVDVIDQGSGVEPEDRSNLFEPFFTTVEEGSGMGLYLCKELCELNGADISYRPTELGESCFRISLAQRLL
jgi:two-component system sensor histidine kinase PilS (NtrC family)